MVKSGIEEKLAGKDYQSGRYYRTDKQTPVMVVRNYTKQLVDSDMISMLSSYSWAVERNEEASKKVSHWVLCWVRNLNSEVRKEVWLLLE